MNLRDKEYKEIFIEEAREIYDYLSRLIVDLEKAPEDEKLLAEIFRLLHNLKANAKAMGYVEISAVSHKMETAFGLIRSKEVAFAGTTVTVLFDCVDLLHEMILNLDNAGFAGAPLELTRNLDLIISNTAQSHIELKSVKRYYNNQNIALSDLINIRIKKLDDLMNLVGELIIDKDRINSLALDIGNDELQSVSSHLHRITTALQTKVMEARLITIGSLFHKFPRIVRDVALVENKVVETIISGNEIQIDRNILQIITDSLLHIVRNSVSHGIESPEERIKKGKPEIGVITIRASNDKDFVTIEIMDDGNGIDPEVVKCYGIQKGYIDTEKSEELNNQEILSFLFEPGFSLSKNINENSGRGVGLDVVKNAIDNIGGRINISSAINQGTTFNLSIPTSMAVKSALLFQVNNISYAIPLIHTGYVITANLEQIHQVGATMLLDTKTEVIPLIYLKEFFESETENVGRKDQLKHKTQDIIIVANSKRRVGLIIDNFLRQQDIVVKSLHEPVNNIDLFDGVTLLGTGEVCLVIDIPNIVKQFLNRSIEVTA